MDNRRPTSPSVMCSTRTEAGGITLPSAMELLPWKCPGKVEMESARAIRHAQEVCRGRRFSIDKDIRQPAPPFVRFVISHSSHFLSQFDGRLLSS